VSHARSVNGLSLRKARLLIGTSVSVYLYRAKEADESELRRRLLELAALRKRFGSPRLHVMIRSEGLVINHKRTERIYREEGLILRRKKSRKGAAGLGVTMPPPVKSNERWIMDLVTDSIVTGRRFRALAIVDDFSLECPGIEVDTSLGGQGRSVLDRLAETRGLPKVITMDNGPEFAGKVLDEWAYRNGVKLNFIRPGKPIENAYAESFNGRFRDECLNTNWFMSIRHARDIIESWRRVRRPRCPTVSTDLRSIDLSCPTSGRHSITLFEIQGQEGISRLLNKAIYAGAQMGRLVLGLLAGHRIICDGIEGNVESRGRETLICGGQQGDLGPQSHGAICRY
jgi:putative transposase